jgi:ketosteroid isomerase-like protein
MRESVSVAQSLRDFYDAFARGDRVALVEMLSDDALLVIGSHESWWRDRSVVLDAFVDEALTSAPRVEEGRITAYEDGPLGWAADRPRFVYPDGLSIAYRYTAVLRRSEGHWRIVQSHLSKAE